MRRVAWVAMTVLVLGTVANVLTGAASADSSAGTVSLPLGAEPYGVAITPDGKFAYVSDYATNQVSVVRTSTNTAVGDPISVGAAPSDIVISPDGATVYTANQNDDTVSAIDVATKDVTSITVGDYPNGLAISPDGALTETKMDAVTKDGTTTVNFTLK